MTVAAELALTGHRMEYVLCIEGIGWPSSETSSNGGSASGFNGTVFATHDWAGTMAADLEASSGSLSVKAGRLALPEAIEEELDPITLAYRVGGMSFEILDDGFLAAGHAPHLSPTEDSLDVALTWSTTTVVLNDGDFSTGAVVWIGGRECVKLGTKSGAGPYTYSDCTRGYLGSRRGRLSPFMDGTSVDASFPADTIVQSFSKFMHGRRVRLYAHVPGETKATASMLLYMGHIVGLTTDAAGMEWRFETTGDDIPVMMRKRRGPVWYAGAQEYVDLQGRTNEDYTSYQAITETKIDDFRIHYRVYNRNGIGGLTTAGSSSGYAAYALPAQYAYRTEPGGTPGMIAAWDTTTIPRTPQAATMGNDSKVLDSYLAISSGGKQHIVHAVKRRAATSSTYDTVDVLVDPKGPDGEPMLELLSGDVRFLLDNIGDEASTSRFGVNNEVRRNPMDVLLAFLTSLPSELAIFDTHGTPGSATAINTAEQYADNLFAGYALFCVEGANKGEARTITSHSWNGSRTQFVVESAFSNAPSAGEEYQVRNTIYDVLPVSWGMGLDQGKLDVDAAEELRDTRLAGATLGRFVLGTTDIDLLEMLRKEICQAYGILMYMDRLTGKLTFRDVGETLTSGVVQTYTSLAQASILEVGDIDMGVSLPIASIKVKTRPEKQAIVGLTAGQYSPTWGEMGQETIWGILQNVDVNAEPQTIELRSPELQDIYPEDKLEGVEISAMLNSLADLDFVLNLAHGRLRRYNTPPPRLPLTVSYDMLAYDLQPGAVLSITHNATLDPYSGTVGLSGRLGRILKSRILLDEDNPGVELEAELIPAVAGARIAPALKVSSKGSDGFGAYFVCDATAYVADDTDGAHLYFAVDDYIELRSKAGVAQQSNLKITAFGTNQASTPAAGAGSYSSFRVYVNAAISPSIQVGDYLTFYATASFASSRAGLYSEYATSAGVVVTGSAARKYG